VSQKADPSKQPPKEAKPSPNPVTLLKPNIELDVFSPFVRFPPMKNFAALKSRRERRRLRIARWQIFQTKNPRLGVFWSTSG
jgi:hypothetical protein